MVKLTVFTPAYNRADLLVRGYESMKRQTNKDFIWMIIDDGSSDGTRTLVEKWKEETSAFQIQYYYKENGGLHTAYNEAISHLCTELAVCVDSDDYMPDDAVEKILMLWEEHGSKEYAGIVGLDYQINGDIIGEKFSNMKTMNFIDWLLGKYSFVKADRTIVVRTDLYKEYAPMKTFVGEKNFNPHYMHLQISKKYDFLVLNENLKFVEYQADGMSNSIFLQYCNSPNSFVELRKLYLSFTGAPFKFKFRHSIHLVSSCIFAGNIFRAVKESPCKGITFLAIPFGVVLFFYIRYRVARKKFSLK